jgi:hypothetical protein
MWHIDRKSLMKYAYPNGLTIQQAIAYTSLPEGTIYELIKTKRIKSSLKRGKHIISNDSLERYLSQRQKFEQDWYTFQHAQIVAGVCKTTLRNWLKTRQIRTKKFDGKRWVERQSFLAFLSKRGYKTIECAL